MKKNKSDKATGEDKKLYGVKHKISKKDKDPEKGQPGGEFSEDKANFRKNDRKKEKK